MTPVGRLAGRQRGDARGTARERRVPRLANGVPDARRGAVRHLHAGHAGVGGRAPAGHAGAHRAAGDGCPRRRALPLHGLPQDHRGRDERAARPRSPSRRRRSARPWVIACGASTASARWTARTSSAPTTPPHGALVIRIVRSPFHRARFQLGDLDAFVAASPGVVAVLTAADIPGRNRVRRDPGDRRSAGVRRARRGGAVPGRGGRHDRRGARADGGAGHGRVPGRLERAAAGDVDRRRPGGRRAPAPRRARGQRPDPWQRSPRRAGPGVRGGGDRGRGRLRDRLRRARVHRAGGRLRGARRRPRRGAGDDAVPAHGPDRARGDPGPARGGGPDQAHGGRRRVREQARSVGAAVPRAGRVEAGPAGAPHLHATRVDDVHDQAASLAAPCARSAPRATAASPRWTSPASSTPARTHRGARRWRTASPCTPAARTSTTRIARAPWPSTRTRRPRARSAGSACRNRRSRRSACSTSSRMPWAWIGSSSGTATRSRRACRRSPVRCSTRVSAIATAWRRCVRIGSAPGPRRRRRTPMAARRAPASASPACGTAAGTRRCRTPRRSRSASGATDASRSIKARSTWDRAPTP